jgi:hypothetical protein
LDEPPPSCVGPNVDYRAMSFEVGGFDVGQLNTILISIKAALVAKVKKNRVMTDLLSEEGEQSQGCGTRHPTSMGKRPTLSPRLPRTTSHCPAVSVSVAGPLDPLLGHCQEGSAQYGIVVVGWASLRPSAGDALESWLADLPPRAPNNILATGVAAIILIFQVTALVF